MTDSVHHPKHYTSLASGVECIDVTEHFNFNRGNAIKYIWRAGLKGGKERELEDLKKAAWYIHREIERLARYDKTEPVAAPSVNVPPWKHDINDKFTDEVYYGNAWTKYSPV